MSIGPSGGGLFTSSQKAGLPRPGFLQLNLAVGATVDVPGPAAGFVRFFDYIQVIATLNAAPVSLLTYSLVDASAVVWPYGVQTAPIASQFNMTLLTPLGAGEVVRIANAGPNAGRISARYVDVPASRYTLVRMALGLAPAVVIPAAPVGSLRRWAIFPLPSLVTTSGVSDFARYAVFNDDSVSCTVEQFVNGLLISRSPAVTATNIMLPQNPYQMEISTALTIGLLVAPTLRTPKLYGAYETLEA